MLKLQLMKSEPWLNVFANDVDAFIPELWASEGLMILVENMISASLVHRDFENYLANFGDVVNTRRPADFTAKRKDLTDNVTIQDAVATNIPVRLDQHIHTSFLIRDGEESKSFKDLVDEFLRPAIIAQARLIDKIVLAQWPQFINQSFGVLAGLSGTTIKAGILGLRQVMNLAKVPVDGRNLVLNPLTESTALSLDLFLGANTVGDMGEALQNATLGRRLGFDMYMDQNMFVTNPVAAGYNADTTAASTLIGATTVVLTTGTATSLAVGGWLTIAGDDEPHQITAWNSGTKTATITPALQSATTSGAAVKSYKFGQVNQSVSPTGYAAGWQKEIVVDTFATPMQVGQPVTPDGTTDTYTVIEVNGSTGITLDRPLVAALADDQKLWPGPTGPVSFAFHKDAIALVVRPLAKPKAGTGALSSVMNWNDLSMRSTITWTNVVGHPSVMVESKLSHMLEQPGILTYALAA